MPGVVRAYPVVVGNVYKGAPAGECEALLARLCEWLNDDVFINLHERLGIGAALLRASRAFAAYRGS